MKVQHILSYRFALHAFVFGSWIIIAILSMIRGIKIDYASFYPFYVFALILIVASFITKFMKFSVASLACELTAGLFLLVIPVFISTFLAISLQYPLMDDWLMEMDQAMGFDWIWFVQTVDQSLLMSWLLAFAYDAFNPLILATVWLLVALDEPKRACAFVIGFGLVAFISSIISIWFPALAAYYSYDIFAENLQFLQPVAAYSFLEQFELARSGDLKTISLDNLSGILTFPSVHAGVSFLVIWAVWDKPYVRWPFILVSLAMAVSTLTHGGHYLVDIVAAIGVVAVVCMVLETFYLREWGLGGVANLFGRMRRTTPVPSDQQTL